MKHHPQNFFFFGLGYSAACLAERLKQQGHSINGTCRTEEKRQQLSALGYKMHLFSEEIAPLPPECFENITYVIHSIPPQQGKDVVYERALQPLRHAQHLTWFAYLSTTGVYGDHKGAWVDETTAVSPPDARTRARVNAENAWLASGLPVHIFRLSGIYGKGRNVLEDVKEGSARRIYKEGQVFSRIHVEDIAETLLASISKPSSGEIYNVCDDEPAPSHEVVEYAAKLLGMEPPPLIKYESAELSEMARSFYASNRRVSNRKIRQSLGVSLRYPTYREGLENLGITKS